VSCLPRPKSDILGVNCAADQNSRSAVAYRCCVGRGAVLSPATRLSRMLAGLMSRWAMRWACR